MIKVGMVGLMSVLLSDILVSTMPVPHFIRGLVFDTISASVLVLV